MALLVSTWSKDVQSMPAKYIMPPERRPGNFSLVCKDIPVIDLGEASAHLRADLIEQILKASTEFGLFQVINHGVSEDLMKETMSLYKEFFNMAAEDKASLYSEDLSQSTRLYTSGLNYTEEEVHNWKDTLKHSVYPFEEYKETWPEKPARYREVVGSYSIEVRKMGLKIWDLISEGLGLQAGCFGVEFCREQSMAINHYPCCPDPSLAMGIGGHCDPNLITVLQQEVYGLQMFKDGKWLGVDPLPNAFVVNICHLLEIISNGKLKSAEHRGVTSSSAARTSIVTFFGPSGDSIIEPAKELVSFTNPPRFKAFVYQEFLQNYLGYLAKKIPRVGTALTPYELQA
ncbi:hypothetical protein LguiB_000357 [Lonicera macranthoides]